MLVLKFGGSSLGTQKGLESVIAILKDKEYSGNVSAAVVSAFHGVTDILLNLADLAVTKKSFKEELDVLLKLHVDLLSCFITGAEKKNAVKGIENHVNLLSQVLDGISLLGELSDRSRDLVTSFGEKMSASLITEALNAAAVECELLDTSDIIKTDSCFGRASILKNETEENIRAYFKSAKKTLKVVTGSAGSTLEGHTTTFGRGGSDLTAAFLSCALGAKKLEIWNDTDGILTADPAFVKDAFKIDELSYTEAMEISHFGANALFPPSVKPALEKNIPIFIRNMLNPKGSGTKITANADCGKYQIRGISSISDAALVKVQGTGMVGVAGFSSRVFTALAKKKISVMLISQSSSEYSICFAVLPEDAKKAEDAINEEFAGEIQAGSIEKPAAEKNLSIIAVVGSAMKSTSGISGKVFHSLGRNGINVIAIAQGSSETNISAVIQSQDEGKALCAIHDAFFFENQKTVNLFLVGTGLIGGTLLDQIAEAKEKLADNMIKIKLIGAANYDKMIFASKENLQEGLDPVKVKNTLQIKGKAEGTEPIEPTSKGALAFVEKMASFNLPNSCFCDCTASEDIADLYEKILHYAIPIVTPNKKANSGTLDYYKRLTSYSKGRGIPYLYECTVGAGLPVISTLRDLFLSGDKVTRIEAVLSGTLSFIFNSFDGKMPFSSLVREAKAKGYTEPDPRDDLNAMDAARKVLILARECGLNIEFKNVTIEPILPQSCFKAKDIDAFFKELEKSDDEYEKRRAKASQEGKQLRYIAVIEEGKAKISLREEGEGSPFRSLVDSDNIVVITTHRYSKLPMVIKGPGAGAQVTAGGVLADILRTARTLV